MADSTAYAGRGRASTPRRRPGPTPSFPRRAIAYAATTALPDALGVLALLALWLAFAACLVGVV